MTLREASESDPATSQPTADSAGGRLETIYDLDTAGDPLLRIRPWWDPELAISGFEARSDYCERFWLPVVGPASLLFLRLAAELCQAHPTGVNLDRTQMARALGLGKSPAPNGPLSRCTQRLEYFSLAREREGAIEVRTHLPPVPNPLLRRVPTHLRDNHSSWLLRHGSPSQGGSRIRGSVSSTAPVGAGP
jgi:hypothetical protein